MTALPPPKVKAFLGKVKEDIIDNESLHLRRGYKALILTELLQRGVLASVSYNDDDISQLVEAVQFTAGKALLQDDCTFPKPLLAGSSAMAGMICEKLSLLLNGASNHSDCSLPGIMEAARRCKDVEDHRLYQLLELCSVTEYIKLSSQLQLVAHGYYLRAASFQPDTPPMWKRALDALQPEQLLDEPIESAYCLENLIRIAQSKGNIKRAAELSLRLAESYLSEPSKDNATLLKIFVSPFRPQVSSPDTNKAQDVLQQCKTSELDAEGILWYQLLALRIQVDMEATEVQSLASEMFITAKNRGTNTSLSTCLNSAQSQVLVNSMGRKGLEEAASLLRDSVLSQDSSSPKSTSAILFLVRHVRRLEERAQAVGLTTKDNPLDAWRKLADFVQPVFRFLIQASSWTTEDRNTGRNIDSLVSVTRKTDWFASCALSSVTTIWMTSGCLMSVIDTCLLPFLQDLLMTLSEDFQQRRQTQSKDKNSDKLVSMNVDENETKSLCFECALALVSAVVQRETTQSLTDQALHFAEAIETYSDYAARFGMAYVLFLKAWSGLKQTPWSFCNVTQARAIIRLARAGLEKASSNLGRDVIKLENLLLDLAEADAEGGFLIGGLGNVASKLYRSVLAQADNISSNDFTKVIRMHCNAGLSRLYLSGFQDNTVQESSKSIEALSEEAARLCLEQASALTSETESELYLGMATSVRITKAFHRSLSSQLIADALIRAGQTKDAEQFLESAVEETPEDFEAVFALGAFRLRTALFPGEDEQTSSDKAAQIQLLKAAKMNSNKAPPFALLGFWYEEKADFNRAVGCYSKALLLYPSDQVAGRGILRLRSYSEVKDFCEAASNSSSPFNGWAWHALGMNNAMIEFDDSQAIVCFQEALRCIDVTAPQNDPLSLFYNPVSRSQHNQATELSLCWADLAGCYRRLGKYSAAIKAYESANEAANGDLHPEVLASWAQVEMELGLAEEAAEKFERCLKRNDVAITPIASYGMGISLLSMAQRDLRDGKAAAALATLTKAVTVVRSISISEPPNGSFHCSTKLLGDLYSFGASLPPAVFDDSVSLSSQGGLHHLRRQLEFVSQGEACYRSAEEMEASHEENADSVRASTACDLGTNVLLQGHILSILHGEGQGIEPNMSASETLSNLEVRKCFDRAAEEFKRSIRLDPTFAPAWCGMGCAVSGLDPLLAQHAFVRAIQLDKSLPDAWANLSFLYASRHSPRAASCVLDELTQVADTPMMWICRAALLERESVGCAEVDGKKEKLSQAADAYEAALQVMKEPSALLGLGMTCRVTGREEAKQQSLSFLTEFSGTAGLCIGADLLRSAILIEDGIRKVKLGPTAWKREVIDSALDAIDDLTNSAYQNFHSQVSASDIQEESKEGYVDMQQISALRSKFGSQVSPAAETQETTDSRRIQLDILHDPNNASMWLSLAKLIAKDMQKTKGDKRKRLVLQTIESANLACDKAVVILTNQVVRPRRDVDLMVTPAQEVAEALALSFMVRKAGLELRGSLKDPPELPRPQSYDLQRSIMIWPRCATARATFAEAEQTS